MSSVFGPSPLQKLEQAGNKQPPKQAPPPPTRLHKSGVAIPPEQSPAEPAAQPSNPAPTKPVAPYRPGYGPGASGPPINSLIKAKNYFGSIADVNERTQAAYTAYQKSYGKTPSPGLMLDVVASPIAVEHFNALFSVPQDPFAARNHGAVAQFGVKTAADVASEIEQAARDGNYQGWMAENADLVHGFASDPKSAATIYRAMATASYLSRTPRAGGSSQSGLPSDYGDPSNISGLAPAGEINSHLALPLGHLLTTAAGQIIKSLAYSPFGIYETGKAVALDTRDLAKNPSEPHPFSRTEAIGKQIVKSTVQDFEHPMQNPGYVFLDALGLLSGGAGAVERTAAAARAATEEGSIAAKAGGVAKALVRKPPPKTYTLTKNGLAVDVLLSDNPLVAWGQRKLLDYRQAGLDARSAEPLTAAGPLQRMTQRLGDAVAEQFSTETKIGRELRAQRTAETAIRNAVVEPMLQAGGWSINTAATFERLPAAVRRGLTRGEQKAIQVLATDAADPLQVHRDFHENMIEAGIGDVAAHRRQLTDLKLAENALRKPSPRLLKSLAAVRDVMEEQQRIKIEQFGLDPATAESRVARQGAILRGEAITEPAVLSDPELAQKLSDLRDRLDENLTQQEEFATRPRSMERAAGGPAEGRKPDATLARLRREESALRDQIDELSSRTSLKTLEKVNPESFYLPVKSEARAGRVAPVNVRQGATVSQYGVAAPGEIPELNHVFLGESLRAGDYDVNASGLAHAAYAKTVKALSRLNDYKRLLAASTEKPMSRFDVPIRETAGVPERLKALLNKIDAGAFSSEDAAGIPESEINDLLAHLYPSPDEQNLEGVRWVDRRLIGDANRLPRRPGKVMKAYESVVNTPLRTAALYIKPSYSLNLLGNAGMAVLHQGFALPWNVLRAWHAKELYGEKATAMLDAMGGMSRSRSYVAGDVSPTAKLSHAFGETWNRLTDATLRRSAVIYELRRMGYRTDEQIKQALAESLHDEKVMGRMTQASRRADKAMVQMSNLTTYEQEVLRHLIFVYPWVSRSAVWSLRTIAEHPIKTAALSVLGEDAEKNTPELAHLESWMKESGYFPIGTDGHGNPKLVNPASINTFSTLAQMAGLMDGTDTLESMLGPGASLAVHEITQRDRFGRTYKDHVVGPIVDSLSGLPQYAAVLRATKGGKQIPPADVTNTKGLVTRESKEAKQPVFINEGLFSIVGPLLVGGLAPRVVDKQALDARYWAAQPADVRQKHNQELMQQALTAQGELLNRKVPSDVRNAVKTAQALTLEQQAFAKKNGRPPTVKEKAGMLIDWLSSHFQIDKGTADTLHEELGKVRDDQLSSFYSMVGRKYGDAQAYTDWHNEVKTVAAFKPQLLDQVIAQGVGRGVIDGSYRNVAVADPKTLHKLGRLYLQYQQQTKKMQDGLKGLHGLARATAEANLAAFEDEHDKPLKFDGRTFPPLPRLAVAFLPTNQEQSLVRSLALRTWGGLSTLDKELLGKPVDPQVSRAWEQLNVWMAQARQRLRPGESLPSNTESYYAGLIAKKVPAFKTDYQFSQQPLAQRLLSIPKVAPPDNRDLWNELLTAAAGRFKGMKAQGWSRTAIAEYWQQNDVPKVNAWLDEHPQFKKEIDSMGTDFVWHLVG